MGAAARARQMGGLQQQVGNARLSRAAGGVVQTRLTVNAPGDVYEQEADQVAEQVMRMPEPAAGINAQRAAAGGDTPEVSPEVESHISGSRGGGQPLPDGVRGSMESRFGQDFGGVRVHTGAGSAGAARDLNAQAFTTGQDIHFGAGQYRPGTPSGDKLLAHELTHTVQQGEPAVSRAAPQLQRQEFDLEVPTPQEAERQRQRGLDLPGASAAATDPRQHSDYIDDKVNAVGFSIYLGGYALFINGLDKPLFVPEAYVNLGLQQVENVDNAIYPDRESAERAIPIGPPVPGRGLPVSYYRGGYASAPQIIFPTIFSPATTPNAVLTMLRARRELAQQVQEQMVILALTLIGAQVIRIILNRIAGAAGRRGRGGRSGSAAGGAAGFTAAEREIVREAHSILTSRQFGQIRTAFARGESVTVQIGGRTIQFEPRLPASGMTNFPDGFLIGREAFASEAELTKTVLHELHRLHTSAIGRGAAASGAAVQAETEAAFAFAERAFAEFF
jgi:hypothetical protein